MSADMKNVHLKYIETHLVPEILTKLESETLVSHEAEHSGGLDGFMSALYNIKLKTETPNGQKERLLIAKFMKGDDSFRETSKAYIQFPNEVFIYDKVLPEYERVLKAANITDIRVQQWVAPYYIAKFGYIEGLSATPKDREAVLVLENLKPLGFTMGPRLYLTREQLLAMAAVLGQYHALSYVLRESQPEKLDELKAGIIPLPFINDNDPNDDKNNLYKPIYRAALDRIFEYFERKIDVNSKDHRSPDDLKLIECMRSMKAKYYDEPTRPLEHLRVGVEATAEDRRFAAILHGDYNRNNVMFKESAGDASGQAVEVRMIDFQELRFGSPAIDLSFYMYINSNNEIRQNDWLTILKEYHTNMFDTLSRVLKAQCDGNAEKLAEIEKILENYQFDKFNEHFRRYGFYGVMICIHFLPWLLSSEETCARLGHLFETDINGEEFHRLSVEAGGDVVNQELWNIIKHACRMGYMENVS